MRPGVTACALLVLHIAAGAKDFYVSPDGNDDNAGSRQRPWRSLDRLNREEFRAGDRVVLAGGSTLRGTLRLDEKDGGEQGKPVVITSVGRGRVTLDGGSESALTISGARFVTIRGVRLTGSGRKNGNKASGLVIAGGSDITVDEVEVAGFQHSGIDIRGVDRVRLTHVYAHENGFAGISSTQPRSRDVYVGYSLAENNPGDPTVRNNHSGNGVVLSYVERGVIEYTEARYNGWDMSWTGNGPVGIWAYSSDRITIQFCVSHHNRSTAEDGGGFDLDGGITNSVVQYNYSHDNFGSGYLICQYPGATEFSGNVVRFNISQDDGLLAHNAGIYVWVGGSGFRSTLVHNNTIVNTKGNALTLSVVDRYKNDLPKLEFYNNIFVSRLPAVKGSGPSKWHFLGNLYWNVGERSFGVAGFKSLEEWAQSTGQELLERKLAGKHADPLLRRDGPALISSPLELGKLHEFLLQEGSPAIGSAVDIRQAFGIDTGPRDFFGSRVGADIGAVQFVSAPADRESGRGASRGKSAGS